MQGISKIIFFVVVAVTFVAACSFGPNLSYASENPESEPLTEGFHDLGMGSMSYVYVLPADVNQLYPDNSWLPPAYAPCFSSLAKTIETFTLASARNSHLTNPSV